MADTVKQEGQNTGWMQAAPVVGAALGMVNNAAASAQQSARQKKLSDIQVAAQNKLTDYNMAKQLQMWKDTNAKAQANEYRKAGLNVGLMYEGGGAGGTTNVATGSVAGGTATDKSMSGGEIAGMGLQGLMAMAQIKNIEADTKVKEATAPNVDADTELKGAQTINIVQDEKNKKALEQQTKVNTEIANVDLEIKNATKDNVIQIVNKGLDKIELELQELGNEVFVSNNTMHEKIGMVRADLAGKILQNKQIMENIVLTKAQVEKIDQELRMGWAKVRQGDASLNLEAERNRITAALGAAGIDVAKHKIAIDAIAGLMTGGIKMNEEPRGGRR